MTLEPMLLTVLLIERKGELTRRILYMMQKGSLLNIQVGTQKYEE